MSSREADAITPILLRAGISRASNLVVHSAFGALSRQGLQAERFIEGLLDAIPNGTLIMPTMTWRTVTTERRDWDELATASHTGVLTEVFRTRYAQARSIHPTHSVAAFGLQATHLTSRHHLDEKPVSANSPYGLMRDQNAFILLLGVGLEACTAIHLPEEDVAPEFYLRPPDETKTYPCRDRYGVVHDVRARRHQRLDRDFPKFSLLLQPRDGCNPAKSSAAATKSRRYKIFSTKCMRRSCTIRTAPCVQATGTTESVSRRK
jgi:aminoglycoside 3-N-acetyltransferase